MDDRDLGIDNVSLADDLSAGLCVSDTGFKRFEIQSGVKLGKALYVKTALLYLIRWLMESQPNSLNISTDGVLNITETSPYKSNPRFAPK